MGDPLPGLAAKYAGLCWRCDGPIAIGDRIAFHRGHPIHVRCASGADDR
jgi:hypothetical protein